MITAQLRSLLSRKLRTGLIMIAIILGVSMISGTYILTDTINNSFTQIFRQSTRNIDAVITGRQMVSSQFGPNPPVPERLLRIVRGTPGVAAADGEIADQASLYDIGSGQGGKSLSHRLHQIGASGGSPSLLFAVGNQGFNQLTLMAGHWPRGRQIAVDESTMIRNHLGLGQAIGVATAARPLQRFRIVGKTRFGSVGSIGGATLIDMDLATAQHMTGKTGEFDQISVMADHGVSQKRIVRRLRGHIPPLLSKRVNVRTGEQQAANQASQIGVALNFLTIALLAFGGVAIFVGAFIIFNTFSITVAQRAREFALLRTLGSSREQILASVLIEALVIGLAASIIGLAAGFGVARGLNALFVVFGADLPNAGLVVEARTMVLGLLVGSLVTVASALMPAVRATSVPPIAAMMQGIQLPRGRFSNYLPYVSLLITLGGLVATIFGIFASISSTGTRLILVGVGCGLLFIGVAMLSPRFVRPLAGFLGWPMERFTAVTGRLARDNVVRNPSRTAITAAALMVGLALVGFVTIFAAELKKTANDTISRNVAGTFIIQNSGSERSLVPEGVAGHVSAVGGVSLVSPVKRDSARVSGIGSEQVDGVSPVTIARVYRFQWKTGADSVVMHMPAHGAIVDDALASSHHLHVGSRIHVLTPAGVRDAFVVKGVYKASELLASLMVPIRTFARDWREPNDYAVIANARRGANVKHVEHRIVAVLATTYPNVSVSSQQQFKSEQDSRVNRLLTLVYVLLGLSIVVSLFGIINTLVLSIYERTREIGMLRAIGMTRGQVRWMIRWESVITSLIGAVLGLGLSIVLAVLITTALQSQGIEFALPIGQLLVWLAVASLFGIFAAAFPARRAARLDVLQAVAYE